jgi:nucleoside-diphosphate-sugar epimerase
VTGRSSIWILGQGYVGTALALLLARRGIGCQSSWRSRPSLNLDLPEVHQFRLDTSDMSVQDLTAAELVNSCLRGLCPDDRVLCTFPLATADRVDPVAATLASGILARRAHLVLLSSTSCYLKAAGLVTEGDVRCVQRQRFQVEESLRQLGAMLVPLSGLYGGDRDPCAWLTRGATKVGSGAVNLIHHDDAAHCLAAILAAPRAGDIINVASGTVLTWAEIGHVCAQREGRPAERISAESIDPSCVRVISNEKLLSHYPQLRHHSFRRFAE